MDSLHPLVLPFFIVLALGLIGGFAAFIRDRRRFAGFQHMSKEVLKLGKAVDGEVFRDGTDLVVNGTWRGCPVDIRFSYLENTPGTDIRMGAPANFSLFVSPRSVKAPEGSAALRTQDEMFNVRAQVRSNHPAEAGIFLGSKNAVNSLTKLYRSSQTYFRITKGLLELTDLEHPSGEVVRGITTQLDAMNALATLLKEMPGSSEIKVEPLKRDPRYVFKFAVLAGIVAATIAVLLAIFGGQNEAPLPQQAYVPEGITPLEGKLIPGIAKWRLAPTQAFDPDGIGWLRASGMEPASRIPAAFSGNEGDVAYILTNVEGSKRIVILSKGRNVYDSNYSYLGVAARVRKSIVPSITWAGNPPDEPDGDGLFVLRTPNDPASGLIIFVKGDRIITAAPKDYRTIRLE